MKEKYTITITENGTSIDIKCGNALSILAWICTLMKNIVERAPSSVCKDKNDRKNLVKSCCKAVEKLIDKEEEKTTNERN